MATNSQMENGREGSASYDHIVQGSSNLSRQAWQPEEFRAAQQAMSPSGSTDSLPSMTFTDSGAGSGNGSEGSQSNSMQQFLGMLQQFAQEEQQMFTQMQNMFGGSGDSGGGNTGDGANTRSSLSDNSQPTTSGPIENTQPSTGGSSDTAQQGSSGSSEGTPVTGGSSDTTQPSTGGSSDTTQPSTGGTSYTTQPSTGSSGDNTQPSSGQWNNGNDNRPHTPTIADQAKSLVQQVDNQVQIGNYTTALNTLHTGEKSVAANDPADYSEFTSDVMSGLEHTTTSDGTSGSDVMNALSLAYVNQNWNSVSVPDGSHRYFDPVDIQNEIGATSDPVDQAILANTSGKFLTLYGIGTVQNADEANSLIGSQDALQGRWTQSFTA